MDVTPLIKQGQQIIQSYADGQFKVSGEQYIGPIIVTPAQTQPWQGVQDFQKLSIDDFRPFIDMADEIDVVLFGTGATMQFFNPVLKNELSQKVIVIDVMDTGAACRTYNVLMAEGRRVAAILLSTQ